MPKDSEKKEDKEMSPKETGQQKMAWGWNSDGNLVKYTNHCACGQHIPLPTKEDFCPNCGKPIDKGSKMPRPKVAKACPKCGASNQDGKYCTKCGTKIS
ncbi:MAG: hypothetical protein V1690_00460 [Candidatus Moraniibacteriota bacterium]